MPTILSFLSGRQITNDSGVPQAGAKVLHYRATTTTALTVWQDSGATIPHGPPTGVVTADAGGFVPLVYVDDTFNWKIVVTTATDVILPQYNFDNLEAAEPASPAATYSFTKFPWEQVSAAGSPVALTAADAGKAYEADTTGGNVEFDLPPAGSMANGTGFIFKKTAASNSMIIDPNGSETIDDVSTSLTITRQYQVVEILSNVAEWYVKSQYLDDVSSGRMVAASDTAQGALEIAIQSEMEAATDVIRAVVPGRQHFHPGHPKCWAYVTVSGGVPTLQASYNITGITDNGVGDVTFTIATDFSSANWSGVCTCQGPSGGNEAWPYEEARAAGTIQYQVQGDTGSTVEPRAWNFIGIGDFA